MNVAAIFHDQYDGELSGAVWLVNTSPNRARFEKSKDLNPNSALFSIENYGSLQSEICEIVWGIQDHFPDLDFISVKGVDLEASIPDALHPEYEIENSADGFHCRRVHR